MADTEEELGFLHKYNPSERAAFKLLCEAEHWTFCRAMYKAKEGHVIRKGRHHVLIANTLDRVISGEIKRLIINIPPGYTKTLEAVIMFIARGFALNPRSRFLHISASDSLVLLNSQEVRDIIKTPEYQTLWGVKIRQDSKAKDLWKTDAGGQLRAVPSNGTVTGFRAGTMESGFTGAMIIDDPIKPDDAESEVKRPQINEKYNTTFSSRLATQDIPVILIMQRVDANDMAGFLLHGGSGEVWHHLNLPIEIGKRGRVKTPEEYAESSDDNKYHYSGETTSYPHEYTHGIEIEHNLSDGPLWRDKHDEDEINTLKRANQKVFNSQYMQDPRHSQNSIFKTKHMRPFEIMPSRFTTVAILVDPAGHNSKSKKADNVSMAVIGIDEAGNKYFIDGYCHKMTLSERWDNLKRLWNKWNRSRNVKNIIVGYEKYGMQTDIAYMQERMELDGPHFAIEEVNWPRSGSHSKESRIARLEPDFSQGRFHLPCTIHHIAKGGDCYWKGLEDKIDMYPARGKTSLMKRVEDRGEGWRIVKPIVQRDDQNNIYDVTWTLMQELINFPNSIHDDISDAVSRVYDLDIYTISDTEQGKANTVNAQMVM